MTRKSRPLTGAGNARDAFAELPPVWELGSFRYRLVYAAKVLDRRIAEHVRAYGVSLSQWRVMYQLMVTPGCNVSALATGAAVDKAEVSRAIAGLLKSGIIGREPNPRDQRGHVFRLTEHGVKTAEALRAPLAEYTRSLVEALPAEDVRAAERVLETLAEKCLRDRPEPADLPLAEG
jgi:DNA-binding MarR family transcriptional regulator